MNENDWNPMGKIVFWGIVGLIIIVGVSIALSAIFFFNRPLGNYSYPFFFPLHFGLFGGFFLIIVIFFIARWLFWPWRGHSYWHNYSDASSILKARYAKGEISKEQFEQMIHDLEKSKS